MSCPMAPLALAGAGVYGLSVVLPLIPSWVWLVTPLVLLVCWFLFVDADLSTFVAGLRGVDETRLRGKVVWVLGASSGIGEEIALQAVKAGAKVVLSARRKDELERVATACVAGASSSSSSSDRHAPMVLPLDVLDCSAHSGAVDAIVARFGRLDIAVLNVGRTQRALAEDTEIEVTKQLLDLNVLAQVSLAQNCLKVFLKQQAAAAENEGAMAGSEGGCCVGGLCGSGSGSGGQFLVTSSVAGKVGAPCISSYNASKFAVMGYFDSLRLEVADRHVGVCVACPGPVSTPIEAAAFTSKAGVAHGETKEDLKAKMPANRCAKLMLAAFTRGIDEAWVSTNPVLAFTYLAQYCPDTARWIGKNFIGPKRTQAFRNGGDIYNWKNVAQAAKGKEQQKKE